MKDRAAAQLVTAALAAIVLALVVLFLLAAPSLPWWSRLGIGAGAVLMGLGALGALRLRP